MTRQWLINNLANDRDIKQTQTKVNYLCEWTAFDMYGVELSARLPGSTIQKYRRTPEITAAAGGLERHF